MGRAVSSAVVPVDDVADVAGVVTDGCGSPRQPARATAIAAIARDKRTKDKGLYGNEHAYGALFDGLDGA